MNNSKFIAFASNTPPFLHSIASRRDNQINSRAGNVLGPKSFCKMPTHLLVTLMLIVIIRKRIGENENEMTGLIQRRRFDEDEPNLT